MLIPSKLCALVVDDNDHGRILSEHSLKQLGILNVHGTSNAVAGFDILKENRIDFILLDWYMPEINGAGFAKLIRKGYGNCPSNIPIIVTTAYATRENTTRIRALELREILIKPFNIQQLGTAVSIALSHLEKTIEENQTGDDVDDADQYIL